MGKLIPNSEKTTWSSLHLQLRYVTSAGHITSLSSGLLKVGGKVSEPAGESVCGQHFLSYLSWPSSLGPTLASPAQPSQPLPCSRDGGLARGSPGSTPQASISAHRLGTDKATDCSHTLPPPMAVGRSGPARLGTARRWPS